MSSRAAAVIGILLGLGPLACKTATPDPVVPSAGSACGPQADGSRRFRVLHINDVYRIEGVADGRGGLGRLRTLRNIAVAATREARRSSGA